MTTNDIHTVNCTRDGCKFGHKTCTVASGTKSPVVRKQSIYESVNRAINQALLRGVR